MTFTYTNVFGPYSPLRGGTPVSSMAGGAWNTDVAITANGGLISTCLASVKIVSLTSYGENSGKVTVKSISSNGMININTGGPASGTWLTFGI